MKNNNITLGNIFVTRDEKIYYIVTSIFENMIMGKPFIVEKMSVDSELSIIMHDEDIKSILIKSHILSLFCFKLHKRFLRFNYYNLGNGIKLKLNNTNASVFYNNRFVATVITFQNLQNLYKVLTGFELKI